MTNRKGLSLFALTMVAIGSSIASGIFATPSDIADEISDPVWIMLLWGAGGLLCMFGALVLAELGSRFPRAGGIYAYINESYGRLPAFLYGWSLLTVLSSGTIAALVVIFVNCLQHLLGFGNEIRFPLAAGSIIILTLFNTFTIRSSEWFANISTVTKTLGIMILLVLALMLGDRAIFSNTTTVGAVEVVKATSGTTWNAIATAFVSVLWTYSGWHYASFVAGDAINPKRNIPRAMIFGTLTVMVVYLLCNLGYLRVFSPYEMNPVHVVETTTSEKQYCVEVKGEVVKCFSSKESAEEAADEAKGSLNNIVAVAAIEKVLPSPATGTGVPISGIIVALLVAISVFGGAGLYVLSTPRVIKVMSEQGLFFPMFGKSHPKLGVPLNALILQSVWAIVLVYFWGDFKDIVNYVTISEFFFLLFTCLSIFIVRYKYKGSRAPFQSVLNPILAAIFCVVVGWFITKNIEAENEAAYYGLLLLPIGVLVYIAFMLYNKSRRKQSVE